ncbi:MAG: nucleoside hydrolase [Anaerolineales bacterium]|nr:nucleoside hydrolase [Anaerolineales bacterium]
MATNAAHRIRLVCATLLIAAVLLTAVTSPASAQDQPAQPSGGGRLIYLPFLGGAEASSELTPDAGGAAAPKTEPLNLIVDTDPGVDDATAITWLFSQRRAPVRVLGIVTMAGNTSLYNATNNMLTLLEALGQNTTPVTMSAASPLVQPLSRTGYFLHGPDGLWFLGYQHPHDLSGVPTDAAGYYCSAVAAHPGVTVLALGPLTNLANAVTRCPEVMRTAGRIIVLGGAKAGGNKTPDAEYNFWQDPEAANIVFTARLPVQFLPLDTFSRVTMTGKEAERLAASRNPTVRLIAPAIVQYVAAQAQNTGIATLPDAVAAVYAVNPTIGALQSSLVQMVLDEGKARGQSIIGLSVAERVAMIADDAELSGLADRAFAYPPDPNFDMQAELGAILAREPDNGLLVGAVPQNLLSRTVVPDLMKK